MKNIFTLWVLLVIMLVACGKREQPVEPYIAATADNYKFFSSGKLVTTYKSISGSTPSLQIEGVMTSGATIKLWIRNYTGALDTLQMDSTQASASYLSPTPSIETISAVGTLVFTQSTPALKGYFDFICTDATHVWGDFKVAP